MPLFSPIGFSRIPLRSGIALVVLAITCYWAVPSVALAKSRHDGTSGSTHKKGATKTTYRASPSEETRAERERRLFRECRGMHNAGACKGYTRR